MIKLSHRLRLLGVLLAGLLLLPLCVLPAAAVTDQSAPDARYPECYQQYDPRWADKELIGPNGCGLLSLVNAVNYLTGSFIDPVPLAVYAHKIDAYNGSVGGGTARWVLYHQLADYEKTYGFKVTQTGKSAGVKDKQFVEHLKKGGAAVCHVYGHFIAIVGYDADKKSYLVYDSAANPDRRGTTAAATWLTEKYLSTSEYMTVDWWCLLERTVEAEHTVGGKTYTDQAVDAYASVGPEGKLHISGETTSSRGVSSLRYVVDYDFDHIRTVGGTHTAAPGETLTYEAELDLSELKAGHHTLRLTAVTEDGGISDVAEYVIAKHDGSDGVDPETGDYVMGFSGCFGLDNVVSSMPSTGHEGPIFRAGAGQTLYVGRMDLSPYDRVVVTYSLRKTFNVNKHGTPTVVGLKTAPITYGGVMQKMDETASLAYGELEPCAGLADAHEAVIDLSGISYSGDVYLALFHAVNDNVFIQSLRFCRAPAEQETLPGTDPETVPDTVPETTPGTTAPVTLPGSGPGSETEAASVSGCGSTVSPCLLCVAPAVLLFAKGRKRRN